MLTEIFTKQKLSNLTSLACLFKQISIVSIVSFFDIFLMQPMKCRLYQIEAVDLRKSRARTVLARAMITFTGESAVPVFAMLELWHRVGGAGYTRRE
jgi:hypothetical protein